MVDREKVKKALERCLICDISVVATPEAQKAYLDCEYTVGRYCGRKNVLRDALDLLKEKEAVKPVRDKEIGRIWLCGKCGTYVGFEDNDPNDQNEFDKFCRECGHPVLWKGR